MTSNKNIMVATINCRKTIFFICWGKPPSFAVNKSKFIVSLKTFLTKTLNFEWKLRTSQGFMIDLILVYLTEYLIHLNCDI